MKIRRAKKNALEHLEEFIVHECHNRDLIDKMRNFYKIMMKIQKRMIDKPLIRKARINMLNR